MALIREDVTSGDSLAAALGRHTEIFPQEYVHLVRAGEMAGALDTVLERLADSLEKRQARRTKVIAALAYPAFMALVGSGVLFFLFSFVVPTLTNLFENLEAALPWPTRLLLAFSGFLQGYWWLVILGLIGSTLLFRRYLKKERNYRRFETMVFKLPLFGSLFKQLRLAQVMRGLSVMTGGGVPLTTALSVTGQGLGRSVYAEALASAAELVGQGRSLADALDATRLFPPLVRRMVAVGETSGTLNEMLVRVAQTYEDETDQVLSALTSLVEPIIILIIGFIAGFVVLAVLLPIFDLSGLVG
jgi:general secretion pathway protein F